MQLSIYKYHTQDLISCASSRPRSLALMALTRLRAELSRAVGGRSLLASIERLPCDPKVKRIVRLEAANSKHKETAMLKQ